MSRKWLLGGVMCLIVAVAGLSAIVMPVVGIFRSCSAGSRHEGLERAREVLDEVRPVLRRVVDGPITVSSTTADCVDSQSVTVWMEAKGDRGASQALRQGLVRNGYTESSDGTLVPPSRVRSQSRVSLSESQDQVVSISVIVDV